MSNIIWSSIWMKQGWITLFAIYIDARTLKYIKGRGGWSFDIYPFFSKLMLLHSFLMQGRGLTITKMLSTAFAKIMSLVNLWKNPSIVWYVKHFSSMGQNVCEILSLGEPSMDYVHTQRVTILMAMSWHGVPEGRKAWEKYVYKSFLVESGNQKKNVKICWCKGFKTT